MKKILLITALFAVSITTVAQKRKAPVAAAYTSPATSDFKPTEGTITAEVGITGGILSATPILNEGAAKFRYFFKDDIAFRLGLGIASDKKETVNITLPGTANAETITKINKFGTKTFNLGVEKHFTGAERLSTYVGFDLLLEFKNASSVSNKSSSTSNSTSTTEGATGYTFTTSNGQTTYNNPIEPAGSSFGFRVTTGADYYFSKKLYLGVEVGLGYKTGTNDQVSTTDSPGITVVNFQEGKTSNSFTNVIGGLKLGYQF